MRDLNDDDLDDLFARAAPPQPVDVGGRARARLRAIRGAWRLTLLALLDLAGVLALGALTFWLTSAIVGSSIPAIVGLALEDPALALAGWREIGLALWSETPWPLVGAMALLLLAEFGLTSYLLRVTDTVRAAHLAGARR